MANFALESRWSVITDGLISCELNLGLLMRQWWAVIESVAHLCKPSFS